MIKTKKNRTRR